MIKLVFGDLARPSRSPLDIQELDVTDTIKMKAAHRFKINVTVEEALQIWENCTQCKIGYGDSYNILGKFDMLKSLNQGENESNLEPWADMSKSTAVPPSLVSHLYN